MLRYLPTNLSAREIADELVVSWYTVKTHMRHLYAKLGTHTRHETVERARALGLLAPSPRRLASLTARPLDTSHSWHRTKCAISSTAGETVAAAHLSSPGER